MRAAIFGDKTGGYDVHGVITKIGQKQFDKARIELEQLYTNVMGKAPAAQVVSDGAVVEYLARGKQQTLKALRAFRDTKERTNGRS